MSRGRSTSQWRTWGPYWVVGFTAGWFIAASGSHTPRLPHWVAYVVVFVVMSGMADYVAGRWADVIRADA